MAGHVMVGIGPVGVAVDHLQGAGRFKCRNDSVFIDIHDVGSGLEGVRLTACARSIGEQLPRFEIELHHVLPEARVAHRRS